jgi:hypothetical protein
MKHKYKFNYDTNYIRKFTIAYLLRILIDRQRHHLTYLINNMLVQLECMHPAADQI